ncbi:serine/threonine protein kinase [Kribbella capetownensis]|uniref:non-specific serine/threonine protein kinase n=1 Tax=Kribbella capetownensis TaxID=1572659 RepID=A0A4R0JJ84_9ACTN|nr:serine/threonine-protein kinase [Kribbella capetownensis]TCC46639.1 serine/threonine protein kinase [Kribbella capetownensis]
MNGEVLAGRYRLLTLLGRGGAGEVWKAEDTVLARQVAVKLLRRLEGDPMDAAERFRAEAQAAARLTHPNVVATYDVGTEGEHVFLVMELVSGPDLAQLMRTAGLPSGELVADIATQGARGLDAAHAAGIVHRDVKPANLMLAADGTLKITDFGIAKRAGNETTGLGVLLGTASYVSPEQVRGKSATPASDWYSFGCVLYELLSGTPPFTGETVDVVMRQHLETPPPPILRSDVPVELAGLVTHLLAKDSADRPSSAAQVAALLTPSPAHNATQVLSLPAPATDEPGEHTDAAEDVVGVGHWEDEAAETGTHRAPRRAFPLAKVGVAAAVVLAAITGGLLLRESVTNEPPAQAGGTPSAPVQKVSVAPKTTSKPTPTPSKTPSKKPKPTPTPKETHQNPQAALVQSMRTLAAQVRATQQGSRSKAPREAAHDLDRAAEALDHGDTESAAEHFYDARKRLFDAQQQHRWRATPQIATLFATIGRALPNPNSDGSSDE